MYGLHVSEITPLRKLNNFSRLIVARYEPLQLQLVS